MIYEVQISSFQAGINDLAALKSVNRQPLAGSLVLYKCFMFFRIYMHVFENFIVINRISMNSYVLNKIGVAVSALGLMGKAHI